METQIFQTNPRLRGLLLILIFTFAASGIALAVLAQIQAYHRDQIYLATESALPAHRVSTSVPSPSNGEGQGEVDTKGWKTYRNEEYGFEIKYPADFEIKQEFFSKLPDVSGGLVDWVNLTFGIGEGVKFTYFINQPGAGCGEIAKQLASTSLEKNGLRIEKVVNIRSDINATCFEYFGLLEGYVIAWMPGKDQEYESIFDKMALSIQPIDSIDLSTWKIYRNEEYGFEFRYPANLSFDIKSTQDFGLIITGTDMNIDVWLKSAKKYDLETGQTNVYTSIMVGDVPGVSVYYSDQLTKADEVFFVKDSMLYNFIFKTVDQNISDQILSTFKFIK